MGRDGFMLADLFHEGLHVFPLLKHKATQVIEGDVSLQVFSKARILHIELKLSIQMSHSEDLLTQEYNRGAGKGFRGITFGIIKITDEGF